MAWIICQKYNFKNRTHLANSKIEPNIDNNNQKQQQKGNDNQQRLVDHIDAIERIVDLQISTILFKCLQTQKHKISNLKILNVLLDHIFLGQDNHGSACEIQVGVVDLVRHALHRVRCHNLDVPLNQNHVLIFKKLYTKRSLGSLGKNDFQNHVVDNVILEYVVNEAHFQGEPTSWNVTKMTQEKTFLSYVL